jgi:hypothetical protein
MRPLLICSLPALAGLTAPARAEVYVRVPFVTVQVGRPVGEVYVRVPFVTVRVSRPVPAAPPAVPAAEPGAPFAPGDPPPVPLEPVTGPAVPVPAVRAPTVAEFAASFRPLPGRYDVVVRHPATGLPVKVCFTLPPGSPRKVRVHRQKLEFVYPRHTVVIRFLRDGSVRVRG